VVYDVTSNHLSGARHRDQGQWVSARNGEPRGSAPRSCGSGRKRNCKRAWEEMARRRCRDCCGRRERCRAPPQPWAPRKLRCRVLTRGSQSQTHALWAQVAAPERKDGVGGGTEGRELFHMRAAARGGMSVDIHCAALEGEPQRSGQCAEQGRTEQRRAEQSRAARARDGKRNVCDAARIPPSSQRRRDSAKHSNRLLFLQSGRFRSGGPIAAARLAMFGGSMLMTC
jgi:hypothetical protein